jgi:hypothetical protein
LIQILVLLGMYFNAVVVFVTSQTLLFRLALAILCHGQYHLPPVTNNNYILQGPRVYCSSPQWAFKTTDCSDFRVLRI